MANLNDVLNERIQRIARKAIKATTGSTKRLVTQHRRDVAALKRQLRDLTGRLASLEREAKRRGGAKVTEPLPEGIRFSARSVAAQRRRLGLSAEKFGKLTGVSALTVYSWEAGKFRPRKEQLAQLVAARKLGKKDAANQLGMAKD